MSVWRVGRRPGRSLYRDNVRIGMVDTPELAEQIVAAMNGELSALVVMSTRHFLKQLRSNEAGHDEYAEGFRDAIEAVRVFLEGLTDGEGSAGP